MTDCITPRAWIPDAAVAIRRGIFGDTGAGKFVRAIPVPGDGATAPQRAHARGEARLPILRPRGALRRRAARARDVPMRLLDGKSAVVTGTTINVSGGSYV